MTDKEKIIVYIDKLLEKYPKNYYLLMVAEFIDSLQEEPVSEELEEAVKNHAVERFRVTRNKELAEKCKWSFKAGAQWQKENLWKPACGDNLPEIDREVIALLDNGKIVFAHRPYKGKYIGKNLTTGNIETFENKTYDKGCWNQPDIRWWLDAKLPKEIEL